jgi:hypothetical protein
MSKTYPRKPRAQRKIRKRTEHSLQSSVALYLGLAAMGQNWWWTSIDHGVDITPAQRKQLAARGIKSGIPDILIICYGVAYAIELKSPSGKQSKAQKVVAAQLRMAGCSYAIARSLADVDTLLKTWGVPTSARVAA